MIYLLNPSKKYWWYIDMKLTNTTILWKHENWNGSYDKDFCELQYIYKYISS